MQQFLYCVLLVWQIRIQKSLFCEYEDYSLIVTLLELVSFSSLQRPSRPTAILITSTLARSFVFPHDSLQLILCTNFSLLAEIQTQQEFTDTCWAHTPLQFNYTWLNLQKLARFSLILRLNLLKWQIFPVWTTKHWHIKFIHLLIPLHNRVKDL